MDLKHLHTFYTLCEWKNFTKTAKELGIAQSAVSTQIGQLEKELGVRLFERIGKTISITAEGDALLPYARQILSLSEDIHTLYHASGRITVGISESIATYLIGDILKEFKALYPDIEVFLKFTDGADYERMLCTGEIDLAIILDLPLKNKYLNVLSMRKENIDLLASSTHPLAGKSRISAEDFKTNPIIFNLPSCPYRRLFEESLLSKGIRPRIALETNSIHVIKESSLCGIGLCLLPEFAVRKELIYHIFEKLHYKMEYPVYTQTVIHQDKWRSDYLDQFLEIAVRHLGM